MVVANGEEGSIPMSWPACVHSSLFFVPSQSRQAGRQAGRQAEGQASSRLSVDQPAPTTSACTFRTTWAAPPPTTLPLLPPSTTPAPSYSTHHHTHTLSLPRALQSFHPPPSPLLSLLLLLRDALYLHLTDLSPPNPSTSPLALSLYLPPSLGACCCSG